MSREVEKRLSALERAVAGLAGGDDSDRRAATLAEADPEASRLAERLSARLAQLGTLPQGGAALARAIVADEDAAGLANALQRRIAFLLDAADGVAAARGWSVGGPVWEGR